MSIDNFLYRHLGPRDADLPAMLDIIGVKTLDELVDNTIPRSIRSKQPLEMDKPMTEYEYLAYLRGIGKKNKMYKTYIGLGYYNTITPSPILRNILENPSWYTSYTPYQAEISQGRLEALLNFQTMVADLTSMEIANASLLDEATAAAEAMIMLFNTRSRTKVKGNANVFLADENMFPQTLDVLVARSKPLGIELRVLPAGEFEFSDQVFGMMVQYPDARGAIIDHAGLTKKAHDNECMVAVSADILALTLLAPPGEWGADVVVGSTQRFGIPMGYGGPHAGYFATKNDFKRNIPGRIIGVSVDRHGKKALRMALQTREQHIRREKATSNICTAQALLATMAGMYAVYHGKEGLVNIAEKIHFTAGTLEKELQKLGYTQLNDNYFDTLLVGLPEDVIASEFEEIALEHGLNFRYIDRKHVGVSVDETTSIEDVNKIIEVFAIAVTRQFKKIHEIKSKVAYDAGFRRTTDFLTLNVFNKYRSETELMRYIKLLERKDFSLTHSMISLGSCTMKLNAATEMFALSWPEFNSIHPFVPLEQVEGYHQLFFELAEDLKKITGLPGISFQPNSGASGEYTGLMVIREFQASRGEGHRNVVLIPSSAHGTNPASAVMAGARVVIVNCDENGNIDVDDLRKKAEEHKDNLCAFMVTYPSTHGVFEEAIIEMNEIIHEHGGQVYMDGANMNAQVGLTSPDIIGADVCHLNLHKTFAIPHGGGGPGMGPICVAEHLIEFLPTHPVVATGGVKGIHAIAAAPFGSASILTISHAYCKMLGSEGLKATAKFAILNANYIARSLKDQYKILYKNQKGYVAHEMILDCRPFKQSTGISDVDIAKRLMDYGFHAPTLSFPVHGTLMVEPTESESKDELDRFIEAMISIRNEISGINEGKYDKENNLLHNAPHTAEEVVDDNWAHPYSRTAAAYPLQWVRENKFWPSVGRLDDVYGDRNLMCSCAPLDDYR